MTALGLGLRWTHLAASVLLVGAFTVLLLAGRSRWPSGRVWERRVLLGAGTLLLVALASGVGTLAWQAALVEGRPAAAFELRAVLRVLLDTQGGQVWLARHGLLIVLAAFIVLRGDEGRRADWLATRGQAALLGLAALGLGGAAGHAAAVEPGTALAIAVDVAHLLAAGIWVGGLGPLALLLRDAGRESGADARPYAVVTARRFSRLALAAVVVLVATGLWNTLTHVGSVAGLVGTTYGRLLLVKLAALVPLLGVALANRRRLLPALSADGVTVGRPAMRRLAAFVIVEAVLALVVLGIVAAMVLTPPARHEQPLWPVSFRLTFIALEDPTAPRLRTLVGSQIALLGVVATVASRLIAARRLTVLTAGVTLLATGLGLALPPLSVDAYPTTYRRPEVPYHADSIAEGARLYREHCALCHGPMGAGDGPAAVRLPRPPADLRSPHTGQHTAGDLYWWITAGIARAGMPAFGDRFTEEQRWDVVNFVRVLGAAAAARALPATVAPERPWLVAPDFSFGVGPMSPRSLRDYRGRRIVVLVLYTLPDSRPRLARLAERYNLLAALGVEIVAVPRDAAPDAIRRLGGSPPVLFPVVTEGAPEIVSAYGLFSRAPHAEFLIDRQGYLRSRWATAGPPERDVSLLLADVQHLNEEKVIAPPADEHVH